MAVSITQLNHIRKKLNEAVGDDFKFYLNSMKLWFKQKISKEDFDLEARKILNSDAVHLHNEFLVAILNRCQSLSSSHGAKESSHSSHVNSKDKQKKGKPKKKARPMRATFEHRFQPANPLSYAPPFVPRDSEDDTRVSFCARDFVLPDLPMMYGRVYVCAWETGLDEIEERAVKLIAIAVQQQMKAILTTICARRSAYKIREGRFIHSIGCTPTNPYLKNAYKISNYTKDSNATSISSIGEHVPSLKPTSDWAESEAALELACSSVNTCTLPPIGPVDLVETLQVHRNLVPSHSVYALNVERALSRIWHPSLDELEQENIHEQEEFLKAQLLKEQSFGIASWQTIDK